MVFFHIHFHRLASLSSVDLTTFLGDGVKSHGVYIARSRFTGQHISTFSVMSIGLIFFIRPTVFKLNYNDALMVVCYGCVTTLTVYTCLLCGVVCKQMMLFHIRHGDNLLFLISFVCTCYVIG